MLPLLLQPWHLMEFYFWTTLSRSKLNLNISFVLSMGVMVVVEVAERENSAPLLLLILCEPRHFCMHCVGPTA